MRSHVFAMMSDSEDRDSGKHVDDDMQTARRIRKQIPAFTGPFLFYHNEAPSIRDDSFHLEYIIPFTQFMVILLGLRSTCNFS
jgi:hypothetical protein